MIKFLVNKYYTLLVIVTVYFIFNLLLRDKLLNWIFNTSNEMSVTDANAYAQENLIRDIFSCCLLILMVTIAVISILLLFIKKGKDINNLILIAVIVFVLFCLFLGIISGSFS